MDYNKLLKRSVEAQQWSKRMFETSDSWPLVREVDGVVVRKGRNDRQKRSIFLAEIVLDYPIENLCRDLWGQVDKIVDWNANFTDIHLVEPINETTRILRGVTVAKGGGIITPREFLYLDTYEEDIDNNVIYFHHLSVHLDKAPETNKYVRADLGPSGCRFFQSDSDPSKTIYQQLFNVDVKVPMLLQPFWRTLRIDGMIQDMLNVERYLKGEQLECTDMAVPKSLEKIRF